MSTSSRSCPNCGEPGIAEFYRCNDVPVHSMVLLRDRREAEQFRTGDIALGFCPNCAFVTNMRFDPAHERYGAEYEASQSHSATFAAFHRKLADDLIARYELRGKNVLEIGCGQGEFLRILCEAGDNRGIGFDPAYVVGQGAGDDGRVRIIADYYSERYGGYAADFVCCKQTLEHIRDTADFLHSVRRAVGDRPDVRIFFQVPDFFRILREGAFWDVYYEHCSYFTEPSLSYLFRHTGFDVLDSRVEYGGQYLMIEARPGDSRRGKPSTGGIEEMPSWIGHFERSCRYQISRWRRDLHAANRRGERTVLWGGGSKAVAFLTTLRVGDEVACAVDINPRKQNAYLAGTGHPVVAPEQLTDAPPDRVIVMNPIYIDEIRCDLERLNLVPALIPVTAFVRTSELAA